MQPGSMITPILMLLFFGWMYSELRHKSDIRIAHLLPVALAVPTMVLALIDGAYWAIFPPANYYPVDDWRALGLTRNKWAAIGIGIAVFLLPELFWQLRGRISPSANLRALHPLPECTLRIWPQSRTANISIRNLAKGPITITRIEAVNSHNERLKLECDTSLIGARMAYLETVAADYRALSWYPPPALWIHGEHVNGLSWACQCKPRICGPDAPPAFFSRAARPLALAAVVITLFILGVAMSGP